MIQIEIFEQVYLFDTIHKAQAFIVDVVGKYFGEDHVGSMDIHIREKEGNPPVLGISVGESVGTRDVGPGQR